MDNPILKIRNLNVEYPLFGGILQREVSCVHAVKNLSIDIFKGKTVGIVGESGSGKSTLGKAILNVLNLTAPDVRITGQVLLNENGNYIDIMSLSKKELIHYRPKMQMIFQDPFSSLNPSGCERLDRSLDYRKLLGLCSGICSSLFIFWPVN